MTLKLRTVLLSSYSFLICLGLTIAFFGIFSMNSVDKEISTKIRIQADNTAQAEQIMTNLLKIELAVEAMANSTNQIDNSKQYKQLIKHQDKIIQNLEKIKINLLSEQSILLFDRFTTEWGFLQNTMNKSESALIMENDAAQKAQFNRLQGIMESFVSHQRDMMNQSIKRANDSTSSSRMKMILILIVCFTLAVSLAAIMIRIIQKKIGGDPDFVSGVAERIGAGDLQMEFGEKPSGVYAALQKVVISLEQIVMQANKVASGDYSAEIQLRSANDRLSIALKQMNENLSANDKHNITQNWLKDGLNQLSQEISGNLTQQQLVEKAMNYIGRYLKIGRGVLYIPEADGKTLRLLGTFAFTERDRISNSFRLGEGVVGQVALEKKPILLKNMGAADAEIVTGTAAQLPYNTYTYPLLYEHQVYGVIEIASTQPINAVEQDFLNQSSGILASYLFASQQKQQVQFFLEQAQQAQSEAEEKARSLQEMNQQLEEQQQQIQQQTEELQQSNAQLEEQQQQLQQQTEELQQSNAQMEEQQQQLQQQQEEMRQTNESLMLAKVDLDKRAQELELSNQYKSEFLANMSHELRTPLNSILMLSKLIARNDKGNMQDEDIKKANVIYTSGEELLRLINDILDLSKIEAGKNALRIKSVDPAKWERELYDYFSQIAQTKGLEFTVTNQIKQTIMTDPDKVSQVLRNFVSNAVKFTHKGGIRMNFSLTDHPLRPVKLEIADSGVGIAPDQQKKIFDAFHQVDSSISREFGGTGLGLTIAKRLTNMLDGEITLSSDAGNGSVFTLWLPLVLKEGAAFSHEADMVIKPRSEIKQQIQAETRSSQPVKVEYTMIKDDKTKLEKGKQVFLIIEDDTVFASIVGNVIHSMGMQFIHAGNAETGLSMAQQYKPSGIILDLSLPDMNGVELLQTLKSSRLLKNIPVQIISSQDKNLDTLDLGAMDFIQKPVEEGQIKDAVAGMLDLQPDQKKQLLIVEDNDIQRLVLQEYISDESTHVTGVATETEALTELKKGTYDAVIVDLGLRQGNGLNLCKTIRQNKLKLPIIVYTGKDLSEAEEKQIKQYADRIIIKTINSVQRLIDELAMFLHKVKKDEELPEAKVPMMDMIHGNLDGKKILIVDDDIKNVFVLSSALENKGLVIHDAQNGKAALEMLKKEEYDLVLMDIMMPVMDGFTAMKLIREDESIRHTPIIALTAKALKEDRGKCLEAGANDYIAKPINYDGLLNLIQAWIHRKV